jgi:hypothetical protein
VNANDIRRSRKGGGEEEKGERRMKASDRRETRTTGNGNAKQK